MNPRDKRQFFWLNIGATVITLAVVITGALGLPAVSIILAVAVVPFLVISFLIQNRASDRVVVRSLERDDLVSVGPRGGNMLVATPPSPSHPAPRRTGKVVKHGRARAHHLDDTRWEVRVRGRRGVQGWIQKAGTRWNAKTVGGELITGQPTAEAALDQLASALGTAQGRQPAADGQGR